MQGVIAAAITPRGPQGDLNLGAAFDLIDYLCASGVDGIALFTSHRDVCSIAADERSRLVSLGRKRSRVPLLVGVGSVSLDVSATLAREARGAGAAAVLLPPLFDFDCSPEDRREFHLQFFAEVGAGIPVFLDQIVLEEALEFVHSRQICGVSVHDTDLAPWLPAAREHRFTVLAHTVALEPGVFQAGGVISPLACAVPELAASLRRAVETGNRVEIDRFTALVREFAAWLTWLSWPVLLQTAIAARGVKTGPLPSPLSPAAQRKLDEFRAWFHGWLPAVRKLPAHA